MTHDHPILHLLSLNDLYRVWRYAGDRWKEHYEDYLDARRQGDHESVAYQLGRMDECSHEQTEILWYIENHAEQEANNEKFTI